jgi:hypothetical protein
MLTEPELEVVEPAPPPPQPARSTDMMVLLILTGLKCITYPMVCSEAHQWVGVDSAWSVRTSSAAKSFRIGPRLADLLYIIARERLITTSNYPELCVRGIGHRPRIIDTL